MTLLNKIPLGKIAEYVSKRQVEFQTAWSVVGQFSALITFETFALVFCTKFNISGTPALFIYVAAPIIAVITVTYMGNGMIRTGYAHRYQKYGMDVNKDWKETVDKVDKMSECSEKILAEIKVINKNKDKNA